jgi:hypothetical protein
MNSQRRDTAMAITRGLVRMDLQGYYGRNFCARTPTPNENIFKNCFDGDLRAWETSGDDINHTFWWITALQTKLTTQDMRASRTINHLVTCIFRNRKSVKGRNINTVVLASAQLMADDPRAFNRVEKFVLEQIENRSAASIKTRAASKRSRKTARRKKATTRKRRAA